MVVIKVNSLINSDNLDLPEPRWAIAYKYKGKVTTAKRSNVSGYANSAVSCSKWNPSFWQAPQAKRTSLHNANEIARLGCIGDHVLLKKTVRLFPSDRCCTEKEILNQADRLPCKCRNAEQLFVLKEKPRFIVPTQVDAATNTWTDKTLIRKVDIDSLGENNRTTLRIRPQKAQQTCDLKHEQLLQLEGFRISQSKLTGRD
jgi:NAD-dependent DNA ligase